MAKYVLGIFSNEGQWATFSDEDVAQAMKAWNGFAEETKASGAFIAGEGLAPTATAKTVASMKGSKKATTDGPFAETKEQLGGFYLLECKDQAEAVKWAKKIPLRRWRSERPGVRAPVTGSSHVARVVDRLFRRESGRAVATLIRLVGDFDLAEEAVQDAFAVAVERWPRDGIPDNPGAWITTTARNRAIDRLQGTSGWPRRRKPSDSS